MSTSEFYEYVTNKNFLNKDSITINNDNKYLELYKQITSEDQIVYGSSVVKKKLDSDVNLKQSIENILEIIEENNLPNIMNFRRCGLCEEEKFNILNVVISSSELINLLNTLNFNFIYY